MGKDGLIGNIIAEVGATAGREGLVRPGDSRWDPETNTLHIDMDGSGVEAGEGAVPQWQRRAVDRETGEVRRDDHPHAGSRRRVLVTDGDPDERFAMPGNDRFRDAGGRIDDFIVAAELREIGEALIEEWPELGHCEDLRIVYVWRRKKQAKAGKVILGTCARLSGELRSLYKADWRICLNAENGREARLSCYQVEALLYHELLHIGPPDDEEDPDAEPVIVGHDIEMFHQEVRRYGFWKSDIAATAEVFEQLRLAL